MCVSDRLSHAIDRSSDRLRLLDACCDVSAGWRCSCEYDPHEATPPSRRVGSVCSVCVEIKTDATVSINGSLIGKIHQQENPPKNKKHHQQNSNTLTHTTHTHTQACTHTHIQHTHTHTHTHKRALHTQTHEAAQKKYNERFRKAREPRLERSNEVLKAWED